MKNIAMSACVVLSLIFSGQMLSLAAERTTCAANDKVCMEFAKLTETAQFERIIEQVDSKMLYSEAAKGYIGHAYLMLAGRESNTPLQEEQFCRKAIEYGSTSAYMGLYFLYSGQDTETALGFLKQYVTAGTEDPVPYVLLGESELGRKNYPAAKSYLREAKKISSGHSAYLDWMLFQASYLTGDYAYASAILDDALAQGLFAKELRVLASDPRFEGMVKRPEFKKYETLVSGSASMAKS